MNEDLSIAKMIQQDIERTQALLNPMFELQRSLELMRPHIALSEVANSVLRHSVQQHAIADALHHLNSISPIVEALKGQGHVLSTMFANIEKERQSIVTMIRPHLDFKIDLPIGISSLIENSAIWQSSLDAAWKHFDALGLLGVRDDLVNRLIAPSRTFSSFMQAASSRLDAIAVTEPFRLIAANTAIKLVERQYGSIALGWTAMPAPVDKVSISEERRLEAPMLQFEGAIEADLDEDKAADVNEVILRVPAAKCAEDARETVRLVCRANEIFKTVNGSELFKPTMRFAEACSELAWLAVTDKISFGAVIDSLYFIFYEGPGAGGKHRLLKENGGPLTDDEAAFIWCVKHLRNKYLRHDPDHGKPPEIQKSWFELREKWALLGLTTPPYDTDGFRRAHHSLIRMAREFTETLLERLTGK